MLRLAWVPAALALLVASPARAAFHLALIGEVMTSLGEDASVQFVEIELLFGGQTVTENSVLAAFDANGTYQGDVLVVPADLPATAGAGDRWLMGTAAFETASGLQVDFEFAPGLVPGSGMVCWGAPGLVPPDPATWDHTDPANYVDCVAYGAFTGTPPASVGTPTPLAPDGHSLRRVDETHDNANDFACGDPADPENVAGQTAALDATAPCPAAPALQTRPQQRCIAALNQAAAALAVAQAKELAFCVSGFTRGKVTAGVSGCASSDARVARAAAKLADADARKCDPAELPDFAYEGAAAVEASAGLSATELLDRLWSDVDAAIVARAADEEAARCQAQAATSLAAAYGAFVRAGVKAKKRALATADSGAALAAALDAALAADPKLARARRNAEGQTAKRCARVPEVDVPTRFEGACGAAPAPLDLGRCVADLAFCHACLALEAFDGLDLDCEAVDGDALYGACAP